MSIRQNYWQTVVNVLAAQGCKTRKGVPFDWETIEAIAEGRGFKRKNIPNPDNMAYNGCAWVYPNEY